MSNTRGTKGKFSECHFCVVFISFNTIKYWTVSCKVNIHTFKRRRKQKQKVREIEGHFHGLENCGLSMPCLAFHFYEFETVYKIIKISGTFTEIAGWRNMWKIAFPLTYSCKSQLIPSFHCPSHPVTTGESHHIHNHSLPRNTSKQCLSSPVTLY